MRVTSPECTEANAWIKREKVGGCIAMPPRAARRDSGEL